MSAPFLDCTDPVSNFDQVVARLDRIIEIAHRTHSRIGYFAALYRHVAVKFKTCVEQEIYMQPDLIERLDMIFFNRYLDALRSYQQGSGPTAPWQVAFESAASSAPTVMQHLMIGMNAHMAFDLALAVAATCPAEQLPQLQGDFITMNGVVASLIGNIRHDLMRVWPLLGLWQRALGGEENNVADLSMRRVRAAAWKFAVELPTISEDARHVQIAALAARVAADGRQIWHPPLPLNLVAGTVRMGELETVPHTIDILLERRRVPERASPRIAPPRKRRKKVAILGGGISALATAFALTDPDNPRADEYELTVYQLGWRLGGKGASGRDPDNHYRIEEHGLHIWFGCYDNAFRLIRKCYAELGRQPDVPLATWRDAFKPHSIFVMEEHINNDWLNWIAGMPTNDMLPGDEAAVLAPWQYISMAVGLMGRMFVESPFGQPTATGNDRLPVPGLLHGVFDRVGGNLATEALELGLRLLRFPHHVADASDAGNNLIAQIMRLPPSDLLRWLSELFEHMTHPLAESLHNLNFALVIGVLDRFMEWFWLQVGDTISANSDHRHLWIYLSFLYANIRGALREDVLRRGFDVLNEHDYREWLAKYAFDDHGVMLNSVVVLSIYDAMFAYVGGDNKTPEGAIFPPHARLEAGTAMRCGLRQFLMYKGAGVWKMQAGMGDVVFAPLYEVLKRRGVKFKFFHRVRQVCPSSDNRTIERIVISRQATLQHHTDTQHAGKHGADEYDPLINVKGLPCWPNRPRYEQLVEGERLKHEQIDLEAYCTPWTDVEQLTLTAGKDFDLVVLGISLGALPYICGDLIASSARWKKMVDHVKTIRTQGFQLWLNRSAYQLGWTAMDRPIGGGFDVDAIDSWADMSHLIERENWPVEDYPQQLAYYCGAMRDDVPLRMTDRGPIACDDAMDQRAADETVKNTAFGLLTNFVLPTMPSAYTIDSNGQRCFRWDVLVDAHKRASGPARFDAQHWHANVQPSERYVLSVPGSTKHRLSAHDRNEFTNLYLAGDWTNNGFNIGCIEAATMSGLLASHAIAEYPPRDQIVGLDM